MHSLRRVLLIGLGLLTGSARDRGVGPTGPTGSMTGAVFALIVGNGRAAPRGIRRCAGRGPA